jgi:protein TonB
MDSPKPIFGVTEESVVKGEAAVSVPVGNTLETSEREVVKTPPPPLAPPRSLSSSGPPSVDDESITEHAKVLVEVKPEYPALAKRLGIEGSVMLRLAVDRLGKVKSARIVKKAGYGMDEAALKAIGSFIFAPARGARHEPLESTFNYEVRFQQSRAR